MFEFWQHSPSIKLAAKTMKRGGVIAYPTEAVWGLGCDPFNENAVGNILALKQRAVDKGLILIASDIKQLDFLLKPLSNKQIAQLTSRWPGPVTWIIPHHNNIPYWVSGKHNGVAVRVSNHPLVRALCSTYGGPIISTSANPQGKPPAKQAWQVARYFASSPLLSMITKGQVGKRAKPSEIIDLLTNQHIRL